MLIDRNSGFRRDSEQFGDNLNNVFKWFSGRRGSFYIILLIILVLLWLASGVYVYRLTTGSGSIAKKLVLLK